MALKGLNRNFLTSDALYEIHCKSQSMEGENNCRYFAMSMKLKKTT